MCAAHTPTAPLPLDPYRHTHGWRGGLASPCKAIAPLRAHLQVVLPDRHKLPVVPLDEQHSPHQEQQAQHQVHPALLGAAAAVSATRVGWATCGGRAIRRALRPGVLSGRADSPQLRGPVGEIGHGQSRVSDVTRLVARIHGHGQDCRSRRGCGVGWWGERGFVGPGGGGDECLAVGHPPQEANRDAAGRWVVGARHGRQAQVAWHGVGVAGSKARCEGCAAAQVAPEPRAGACNHCRGGGGGGLSPMAQLRTIIGSRICTPRP